MTFEGHVRITAESSPASGDCVSCRGESPGLGGPGGAGAPPVPRALCILAGWVSSGQCLCRGSDRQAGRLQSPWVEAWGIFPPVDGLLASGQVSARALCLVSEIGKKLATEL